MVQGQESSRNTKEEGFWERYAFIKQATPGLSCILTLLRTKHSIRTCGFISFINIYQGGFAKCYELKDFANGEITAGKIVPKSLLVKAHQREKMAQEISLHKTLSHQYIVKLYSFFEDQVQFQISSILNFVLLHILKENYIYSFHTNQNDGIKFADICFKTRTSCTSFWSCADAGV